MITNASSLMRLISLIIALDLLLLPFASWIASGVPYNETAILDSSVRRVIVQSSKIDSYVLDQLSKIGFRFESQSENLIQGSIPESNLEELALLPSVLRYNYATPGFEYALTNEAVNYTRANMAHPFGLTGRGVKVGVLDIGFEPSAITFTQNIREVRSFRADGDIRGSNPRHGVAVAEILLGIAPDAELYLYNLETEVEFLNAVELAIRRGVNIISTSIGFLNLGPYDGSSRASRAIDRARAMGILPVVAAGNAGESHWSGKFKDENGNNFHEFFGQNERNAVNLERGERIEIQLSWDDWPSSAQNYDLFLLDSQSRIVASSTNIQRGLQPPTESVKFTAPSFGTYYISIRKTSATRNVNFELFVSPVSLRYFVPEGSIAHIADAKGAVTVGASSILDDRIQPYSSRGPTNDGRIKPDIVAPDGLTTSVLKSPFRGTSPSAPVVAGIAALLLSGNPNLTPDELQTLLEKTAIDLGPPGKDNIYGSGRVRVKFLYLNSNPKVSSVAVDGITYPPSELPKAFIWAFGTEHTISVPSLTVESDRSRHRFRGWSDGMTQTSRRIIYDASQNSVEALFSSQHYLTIESPYGKLVGEGWYDSGSVARFSAPSFIDHGNGTRRIFVSWQGDFSRSSTNGTLVMNSPTLMIAKWRTQYLISVRSNVEEVEGAGWYDAGSKAILKAKTPSFKSSNMSREAFVSWSGSIKENAAEVSVTVLHPLSVEANWKSQHFLKIISDFGNPRGEGWYDAQTKAQFSVEPRIGVLVEQVFDGWDGDSNAQTAEASIIIDSPKVVVAKWRTDYGQLIILIGVIVATAILVASGRRVRT